MENRRTQYRVAKNFVVDYSALRWTVCHSFFCPGANFSTNWTIPLKRFFKNLPLTHSSELPILYRIGKHRIRRKVLLCHSWVGGVAHLQIINLNIKPILTRFLHSDRKFSILSKTSPPRPRLH